MFVEFGVVNTQMIQTIHPDFTAAMDDVIVIHDNPHMNDPAFADAMADALHELISRS